MDSAENDPQRSGTIWILHLDWPTPNVAPLVPATFARLGPEMAATLAGAMGLTDPAVVHQRFQAGRRCYAAWVGETLAAYSWVSFDDEAIGEMRVRIRLAPGEAYIWDCATLTAYRRCRLYTALLTHVIGEMRAEGLCRLWIGTDQENVVSQKGIARAGFLPVADLVVTWVVAIRKLWVGGRPGVPDGWVSDARRALLGDRDQAWLNALSMKES